MTLRPDDNPSRLLLRAQAVEAAAQRAVRQALWEHRRAGNPVAVWENGRVVWIPPEEIDAEGPTWEPQ